MSKPDKLREAVEAGVGKALLRLGYPRADMPVRGELADIIEDAVRPVVEDTTVPLDVHREVFDRREALLAENRELKAKAKRASKELR